MSGTRRSGSRRPARPAVVGDNENGYVETDPTGRYGRFDEVLGKGAMKTVYRGFDEELGVEVAWNQASLCDVLRTPDAVQRMYSEVQLLRELRHESVIALQAWWVHPPSRTFNFITELLSSGTLRSYRVRYPRVRLGAVRSWARQILRGLAYLHARRVIHRDLKCDNILVNGHLGQVKIADLGLAAVLKEMEAARSSVVGTPEFMAPEMYEEEYDERVDVYAFGMCMLEMLTLEFPYAECSNPAQIYKKVTGGRLPDAFHRVKDPQAQRFVGRCLAAASDRPSAHDLLQDPFLLASASDRPSADEDDASSSSSSLLDHHHQAPAAARTDMTITGKLHSPAAMTDMTITGKLHSPAAMTDMTITGKLNADEDTIFLKVQIADAQTAHVRNIYFPFDMASDTAIEVASEMVKELDITDRDPSEIAAMIDQEIDRLLPGRGEQHEYEYSQTHEHDDENDPPFYYLSSSPTSSCSGTFSGPHGAAPWSKDHGYYSLSDDDDTSSMHSGKYSALHYVSGHQQDNSTEAQQETDGRPGSSSKATRFGPAESSRSPRRTTDTAQIMQAEGDISALAHQLQRQGSMSPQHAGRPRQRDDEDERRRRKMMSRNRSMVDMRSQLLHRTLVEELNRRLFFNTVGAVENIGFRTPQGYGSSSSSSSSSTRGHRGRRSKEDDNNQRYYML